jgi:hypothetical protein
MILLRVDPLIGDERETNKTTDVATQQILNKQQLNREERCFLSGPCRDVTTRQFGAISQPVTRKLVQDGRQPGSYSVEAMSELRISQRATTLAQKVKDLHCSDPSPGND